MAAVRAQADPVKFSPAIVRRRVDSPAPLAARAGACARYRRSRVPCEPAIYWMALAAAVAAIAVVYLLLRSGHSLALTAIRDSEVASASQGIAVANGDGIGKSLLELTSG